MNSHLRGRAFALGVILILGCIVLPDNNFLYAKDDDGIATYTSDPSYTGDPVPDDTKQITITFKPENNQVLKSLQVKVNGKDYEYKASELNNGVLTMQVSKTKTQLIDFVDNEYGLEPSYIMVNEEKPDVVDNYNIKIIMDRYRDTIKIVAKDANGNKKDLFDYGETAYISLSVTKPMTVLFHYGLDGNVQVYNQPFKVSLSPIGTTVIGVQYTAIRYYPGESPPTVADIKEEDWENRAISFKGKPLVDPTPDPSPSYPTFKDKDGNTFDEKNVKLDISTLKNIDSYKTAIASYPEFTSIPTNQISYFDISVLAGTTKVQPINKYDFVIPFPTGSTKNHEFVVYHFKNDDVKQPEKLEYEAKSDGLHVSVNSFSPFVVGWKEKIVTPPVPDSKVDDTVTNNISTGDSSEAQIWLTTIFLMAGILIVQGVKLYQNCHED